MVFLCIAIPAAIIIGFLAWKASRRGTDHDDIESVRRAAAEANARRPGSKSTDSGE